MPLETPPAAPAEPITPAAPVTPAEPALNLDTAFSDAAAAQSLATPEPSAPQPSAPETPSTPAAPQAPAAQPAAPAAPGISPSLLARAQAAQLPLDGISTDADLAAAILDHYQTLRPYAELGRQQVAQPAQPQAPETPKPAEWSLDSYFEQKWQVPAWKPEYDAALQQGLLTRDPQTGLYVAAEPRFEAFVLPILSGINAADAAIREQRAKLFEGNPLKNFYDALEEPIVKRVEQLIEQRFGNYSQTQQQQQVIDQFEQANAGWLYQPGTQTFSPQGQAFAEAVQSLREEGVKNPQTLIALGMKLAGVNPQAPAAPAATPAAPAAPAAQAAAAPNPTTTDKPRDPVTGQFLPAAAAQPAAPAAPAPSKQEAFLETARKRSSHSPSRQDHSGASPDEPVLFEQGEMDNFFKREYQARRQAVGAN